MITDTRTTLLHREAEDTVTAWILQSDENVYTAFSSGLRPEMFSIPAYSIIAEAANRFIHESGDPYSMESLHQYVAMVARDRKGQAPPLSMLVTMATTKTHSEEAYLMVVKNWHLIREARNLAEWITSTLAFTPNPLTLLSELSSRIDALRGETKSERVVVGEDAAKRSRSELRHRVQQQRDGSIRTYPWPWALWEKHVLHLGDGFVGCIYALDKIGKSAYLENIAEYWTGNGLQVAFIHAENQLSYTQMRRQCRLSGYSFTKIRDGLLRDDELEEIERAESVTPGSKNLHYIYGAGADMETLCADVRQLHHEGRCDAVVLDYLQKVQFSRHTSSAFRGNDEMMQAHNAELLKSLAANLGIPIMTASQMRKSATTSTVKTRQEVRGSGQISEKFQLAITLDRPLLDEAEARFINDKGKLRHRVNAGDYSPIITVRVDAQNVGGTATFKQMYHGDRFLIVDPPLMGVNP